MHDVWTVFITNMTKWNMPGHYKIALLGALWQCHGMFY
jgi:hypothetical protein